MHAIRRPYERTLPWNTQSCTTDDASMSESVPESSIGNITSFEDTEMTEDTYDQDNEIGI